MNLKQVFLVVMFTSIGLIGSDQNSSSNQLVAFNQQTKGSLQGRMVSVAMSKKAETTVEDERNKTFLKLLKSDITARCIAEQQNSLSEVQKLPVIYKQELKHRVYDVMTVFRKAPRVIIDSVTNSTPYPLKFTDRYHDNNSYALSPKESLKVNYNVGNYANLGTDDTDAFSREAQFFVEVLDSNNEWLRKQFCMNMAVTRGNNCGSYDFSSRRMFLRVTDFDFCGCSSDLPTKLRYNGSKDVYVRVDFNISSNERLRSYCLENDSELIRKKPNDLYDEMYYDIAVKEK